MAVPKKRTPKSKKGMRRSHHGRKALLLTACAQCKSPILPHRACPTCGMYRGRAVLNIARKTEKMEQKRKAQTQK